MANYVSKENLSLFKTKQDNYNEKKFAQKTDLTNLATKAEVSAIPKYKTQVVDALPTTNISASAIYLVKTGDEDQNLYTEYIRVADKWEKLGTQKLSLAGYTKDADLAKVAKTGKFADLVDEPTALKNPAALTFTGGVTGSYDGSAAKSVAIPVVPSALKNPQAITFTGGATGTYDGSTALTVSIPAYATATSKTAGLLSAADKAKLDTLEPLSEDDIDSLFTTTTQA